MPESTFGRSNVLIISGKREWPKWQIKGLQGHVLGFQCFPEKEALIGGERKPLSGHPVFALQYCL